MGNFRDSVLIGDTGEDYVISYLQWKNSTSKITKITSKELQKTDGDFYWSVDNIMFSVDVKTEQSDRYGNFFFEYWSNRKRDVLGWGPTSAMMILAYLFLTERRLFLINFKSFQDWAYKEKNIFSYPLKKQNKYDQLNDSWGYCVPISVCLNTPELRISEFNTLDFYRNNFLKSESL